MILLEPLYWDYEMLNFKKRIAVLIFILYSVRKKISLSSSSLTCQTLISQKRVETYVTIDH